MQRRKNKGASVRWQGAVSLKQPPDQVVDNSSTTTTRVRVIGTGTSLADTISRTSNEAVGFGITEITCKRGHTMDEQELAVSATEINKIYV